MRLISCYIENFGGLQGYSLSFQEGLTVLHEANGFGKTTLAEFLRVMLYGLPARASSALDKNPRRRCQPWQGGTFGGSLTFLHEGVTYRVERTFGASAKEDSFVLYETDPLRPSTRFSDPLGQELFGLDADSFSRSVFLQQAHLSEPLTTNSIQAKLTGLVEASDDIGSFDRAVKALRDKRSRLIAFRGNGGSVAQTQEKISVLQQKLSDCLHKQEQLGSVMDERETIRSLLDEQQTYCDKLTDELSVQQPDALSPKEAEKLSMLEQRLPKAQYNDAALAEIRGTHDRFLQLQGALDACKLSDADKARLEKLSKFFAAGVPSEHTISGLQSQLNNPIGSTAPKQKKAPLFWLLLILGILAAAGGGYLLYHHQLRNGSCALGLGVVLLFVAIFLRLRLRILACAEEPGEDYDNAELAKERIEFFIARYPVGDVTEQQALTAIAANRIEYLALSDRQEEFQAQYSSLCMQADAFHDRIKAWQYECGLDDISFEAAFEQVRDSIHLRDTLSAKEQMFAARAQSSARQSVSSMLQQERETLRTMQQRLIETEHRISTLQSDIEQLPAVRDELARLNEQKSKDTESAAVLDRTIEYLIKARETLSCRYLDRIQKRFLEHLHQVAERAPDNALIGTGLDVRFERRGAARELGYFSTGERDIVMLCMRLALVDALFEEATPFLVLDDPFINLDDNHRVRALEVLRELSEQYQIVYLTCSAERCP